MDDMGLDKVLFAAVLALCAVVVLIAFLPDAGVGGVAHPEHPTMRHSGSGERHAVPPEAGKRGTVLWAGWLFGVAIFGVFASLIAFGARHRIRDFRPWLVLTTVAVIGAWTWVVFAYRDYLGDPAPALYGALPAPTAVMIYLFWPLGGVFVLLFVLGFRRWVLSDDDVATYRRLLGDRAEDEV